jgi:hypothetical protein
MFCAMLTKITLRHLAPTFPGPFSLYGLALNGSPVTA